MNAVTIWPLAPNAAEAEYPDLDLNQGLDLRRVQCYPLHHQDKSCCQYPGLESNQDQDLRRVLCYPLHHRDARADDWIRTSIIPLTRRTPFYVEPRRHEGSRPEGREPGYCYASSLTFQYASLMNFDQLSIRRS